MKLNYDILHLSEVSDLFSIYTHYVSKKSIKFGIKKKNDETLEKNPFKKKFKARLHFMYFY